MTPGQQQKLTSWAEQRDELIRVIADLETRKNLLDTSNKEAAESFTELTNRISHAKGKLEEILALEERVAGSTRQDIVELLTQKSRLESEIETKKAEITGLDKEKALIVEMITTMSSTYKDVFDKVRVLENFVQRVKEISGNNIVDITTVFTELKSSCEEIIKINGDNVSQTKIILEKLPKYIFELQKPIPIRRLPQVDTTPFTVPKRKK